MKKKNKMLNLCQIYFEKSLMDKFLMRWKLFLWHLPSLLCHNFKYIYVISCSWFHFVFTYLSFFSNIWNMIHPKTIFPSCHGVYCLCIDHSPSPSFSSFQHKVVAVWQFNEKKDVSICQLDEDEIDFNPPGRMTHVLCSQIN